MRTNCDFDGVYQVVPEGEDCSILTIENGKVTGLRENQPIDHDLPEVDAQVAEGIAGAISEFYGIQINPSLLSVSRLS